MLAYVPMSLACKGNTKCQAKYRSNRNKQINYNSTGNSREPGLHPPNKTTTQRISGSTHDEVVHTPRCTAVLLESGFLLGMMKSIFAFKYTFLYSVSPAITQPTPQRHPIPYCITVMSFLNISTAVCRIILCPFGDRERVKNSKWTFSQWELTLSIIHDY